jgi:hypothetical protein
MMGPGLEFGMELGYGIAGGGEDYRDIDIQVGIH